MKSSLYVGSNVRTHPELVLKPKYNICTMYNTGREGRREKVTENWRGAEGGLPNIVEDVLLL